MKNITSVQTGMPHIAQKLLAATGLVIAAPIMAGCAVAVASTSKGPILFRQERMGQFGEPFTLYKFRTMTTNNSGPKVTARGDSRITKIGKILRKSKLDELPELWNVVNGTMALVGPRPEAVEYVELDNALWEEVLKARPGITDPVTLNLRNEEELLEQITCDREIYYKTILQPYKLLGYLSYLQERTALSDLAVLFRTVGVVILPQLANPPAKELVEQRVKEHQNQRPNSL
jgi:lipopolysaccharide/colanic/teichoic acid biosynthesis glycosyltransferase